MGKLNLSIQIQKLFTEKKAFISGVNHILCLSIKTFVRMNTTMAIGRVKLIEITLPLYLRNKSTANSIFFLQKTVKFLVLKQAYARRVLPSFAKKNRKEIQ